MWPGLRLFGQWGPLLEKSILPATTCTYQCLQFPANDRRLRYDLYLLIQSSINKGFDIDIVFFLSVVRSAPLKSVKRILWNFVFYKFMLKKNTVKVNMYVHGIIWLNLFLLLSSMFHALICQLVLICVCDVFPIIGYNVSSRCPLLLVKRCYSVCAAL